MTNPETTRSYEDLVRDEVTLLLKLNGISTEHWGEGKAKTVEDLVKEVVAGECLLDRVAEGEVKRMMQVARVHVSIHLPDGRTMELWEDKQVMESGGERERGRFGPGLAEKMTNLENPAAAAVRGIEEELFDRRKVVPPESVIFTEELEEEEESQSYPGLVTQLHIFKYEWHMPEHLYKEEGYEETKPNGQKTFFAWQEVNK